MKQLIAALIMTFATTAFAGPDIVLNDDGSPFITIEKILLPNQRGEETECGVCCSWTTTGKNCIPTCIIEDGNMIPAAALPPETLPSEEFCRRFPGSNFCGGKH